MDVDLNINFAHEIILSKKIFIRDKEAIDRISDIFFKGLKEGLSDAEWKIVYKRIEGLREKKFPFLIFATKHTDGTIYSTLSLNPYEIKLKKFNKRLKLWFSLPRKRKQLKDDFWLEEQDKEYLLTLMETAFENGLDDKQKQTMNNLLYPNKFIYFEFTLEKGKTDFELVLNYY
ncbi:MAG: hypothetical protein FK734_14890 [Asgard group archaeon]|nr:hypothetical protein [Asgard group archaeon]